METENQKRKRTKTFHVSVLFVTPKKKLADNNYATAYMDNPTKIRIVTSVPMDSVVEI